MRHQPLRKASNTVYADFGFTVLEVFACTFCGAQESDELAYSGRSLVRYSVPITRLCPVAGLVGVCLSCLHWLTRDTYQAGPLPNIDPAVFEGEPYRIDYSLKSPGRVWTPPAMTRPVNEIPIYVLLRGFVDDERLGRLVRHVWGRIPAVNRRALRQYLERPAVDQATLDKGALRVEALPNWPGRVNCRGQCMNSGRAIRLHSPTVSAMSDDVAGTLLAHELAHVFQHAAHHRSLPKKYRQQRVVPGSTETSPTQLIEEDAHELMGGWGFEQQKIWEWREEAQEKRWERQLKRWAAEPANEG